MRDLLRQLDQGETDPVKAAQHAMRTALPKRFYSKAGAAETDNGFAVLLDGKPVRTPAKRHFLLPTRRAAEIVAAEFEAQEKEVDPARMPVTRLANTTIDGVADDPQAVAEDIVKYSASDLICYRADAPRELVAKQAEAWDPLLDWMRDTCSANFILAEGVMPVTQPREAIGAFAARLKSHAEPFRLACLHTMTTLTGSAILALAVVEGIETAELAWEKAHVDEDWNIAQWGEDAEAAARRAVRRTQMMAASALMTALD